MSANISNVINVTLNEGRQLAQADNQNVVAVITSNPTIGLDANNRTLSFTDLSSVATAFGTTGAEYDHAATFFSTSPNAVDAGGRLVFAYRDQQGGTPAVAAQLTGGIPGDTNTLLTTLQGISDGYFTITVDGTDYDITGLDFTSIVSLSEAADVLDNGVSLFNGIGFQFDGQFFILADQSNAGSTSSISTTIDNGLSGTYVGSTLLLESGLGATVQAGADATPGTDEDIVFAMEAALEEVAIKGWVSINPLSGSEYDDVATYVQGNEMLFYEVFSDPTNLETQVGNPAWDIKLASQTNFRMLYSKSNNRRLATSYMARMHSVNFNAENSAITMHLKTLSVSPDSYTQTEIDQANNVGLDIYTTIKDVPVVLTSGQNDFTDNRYNLISFVEEIKVDSFNVLKGTSTKIAQTVRGVNVILDQLERTTEKYVNAGVFAPGTWTSPDRFGDVNTFNRSIESNGYYWKAGSLSAQSQADREARKSPVFQGAVKAAGAIHSADIIINFNK